MLANDHKMYTNNLQPKKYVMYVIEIIKWK